MTTVEGLGSTRDGLSAEQDRLSRFHGTQCGFCTPGMVMSMHGLRRRTEKAREEEPALETVEGVLDGNLCRCTGYRPILDAFKSFSPDAPDELKKKVGPIKRFLNYSIFLKLTFISISQLSDIEDLGRSKLPKTCPKSGRPCVGSCSADAVGSGFAATVDPREKWHQPTNLQELLGVLKSIPDGTKYVLQGGNTGYGVYEDLRNGATVFVDINRVKELRQVS